MDQPTVDHRRRLAELMGLLEGLPIEELMREAARIIIGENTPDQKKARFRFVMGGCYAISKTKDYLLFLRGIDERRLELGRQIHSLLQERDRLGRDRSHIARIATTNLDVFRLSGEQEIVYHLFAVCVSQIARLLPIAARGAGTNVGATDLALFDSFKKLRDHFEHLDQRLPAKNAKPGLTTESGDDKIWHIRMGLESDELDRIVLNGEPIDVTSGGGRAD